MAELLRFAKYLKKFTDVQLFVFFGEYSKRTKQDAWLFLCDGGWEEVNNGRIG